MRNGISIGEWRISEARYRELMYFCMQHPQKRAMAESAVRTGTGWLPGGGRRDGGHGDPTLAAVARRELLLRDVEAVDESARDAVRLAGVDDGYAPMLVAYVCGTGRLHPGDFPLGRRQFYRMRRYFYRALDARRMRETG